MAITDIFGNEEKTPFALPGLDDLFSTLPEVEKPKKKVDPNEKKYIIYSLPIDKLTIKRVRNLVTPAVCDLCGFDVLALAFQQNKAPTKNYNELPSVFQEIMKAAIRRHKELQHSNAEALILGESELPIQWLSREV